MRYFDLIFEDTKSPEFLRWFGTSKVVDRSGNPLRMFHGTGSNFDKFHAWSHFGTAKAANDRLSDAFGSNESIRILPVFLRIENPLRVTDQEASDEATMLNAIVRGKYGNLDKNMARRQGVIRVLTDAGYDGLVYRNRMEDRGRLSWVIFNSDQVKSSINS